MTWVKTQGVFTNKPGYKSWLVSKSRSESRCRSARWWLAPRLSSEYHNRTDICFTNTRNYCHRNKIYVSTSLLKQIYLQSAECARIYCTVNTVCHSCYHHREFTSRRTHEQRCGDCGFEMTSQLLPLTLGERTSHRQSNDAIRDLRHDLRRDSIESRWFSFVNTTWLGPGPSLKWDSVRVQAKSWVKSQVKTVSEYGPLVRDWSDSFAAVGSSSLDKQPIMMQSRNGQSKTVTQSRSLPIDSVQRIRDSVSPNWLFDIY